MSLPLLKSPEHLIYSNVKNADRTIRRGRIQHTKLRWREDNMHAIPINIGFAKVPVTRLEIFEQSLTSIVVIKNIGAP